MLKSASELRTFDLLRFAKFLSWHNTCTVQEIRQVSCVIDRSLRLLLRAFCPAVRTDADYDVLFWPKWLYVLREIASGHQFDFDPLCTDLSCCVNCSIKLNSLSCELWAFGKLFSWPRVATRTLNIRRAFWKLLRQSQVTNETFSFIKIIYYFAQSSEDNCCAFRRPLVCYVLNSCTALGVKICRIALICKHYRVYIRICNVLRCRITMHTHASMYWLAQRWMITDCDAILFESEIRLLHCTISLINKWEVSCLCIRKSQDYYA